MSRKVIRKLFWVWQFEQEEAWLNDMARQGWVLDKVGFCRFEFKKYEPGEYNVRLELLEDSPNTDKSMDYISFVEETGAEYIGSMTRWVYFRKKAADGEFNLFSDIDSRLKHLDTIIRLPAIIALANLLIGFSNLRLNGLGWINIACAALLGWACWKLNQKKEKLQRERTLHE